jgi:hypothetical protein
MGCCCLKAIFRVQFRAICYILMNINVSRLFTSGMSSGVIRCRKGRRNSQLIEHHNACGLDAKSFLNVERSDLKAGLGRMVNIPALLNQLLARVASAAKPSTNRCEKNFIVNCIGRRVFVCDSLDVLSCSYSQEQISRRLRGNMVYYEEGEEIRSKCRYLWEK